MTEDSKTLRSRFGLVATVLVWVVCAVTLVAFGFYGYWGALLRFGPLVLLIAFVMWLAFWAPNVTITPGGVEIRNLVREHLISWPAIRSVDTKYALTLETTAGKLTAWAAPAPSRFTGLRAAGMGLAYRESKSPNARADDDVRRAGRLRSVDARVLPASTIVGGQIRPGDIPSSDSGLAALYVRRYWEELRDGGYLRQGVVEGTGVRTTWLRGELVVLACLTVVTALCLTLVH